MLGQGSSKKAAKRCFPFHFLTFETRTRIRRSRNSKVKRSTFHKFKVWRFLSQISNSTTRHSVTQSISHSVTLSLRQSVNQSLRHSVTQSLSRSVAQSLSQSVSQSISHSVTQSFSYGEGICVLRLCILPCF